MQEPPYREGSHWLQASLGGFAKLTTVECRGEPLPGLPVIAMREAPVRVCKSGGTVGNSHPELVFSQALGCFF